MSIQIIKQGRLPEEKRWSFCCRNCGTEFTAQKFDGYYFDDRDGTGLTVSCPMCKNSVTSFTEYQESLQSARLWDAPKPPNRGWQDYVLETNPHNR